MKILQINCVYAKGSTGKITADIHRELQRQGFDSVVLYGRREKSTEKGVYKTCPEWYSKIEHFRANVTGVMYGGCELSTLYLIYRIKREKPDVVHLQCINGHFVNIYRLLAWLKKNHIKTVVTLHAEFMYTGGCGHSIDCEQWRTTSGCGHPSCPRWRTVTKSLLFDRTATMWRRMKKAFDGFNPGLLIISVSPWVMERAKQSPILCDKQHAVVLNGLDTGVFHYMGQESATRLRQIHGLTNEHVLFHATPLFSDSPEHIKGGYYVIELAKRLKDQDVKILVAGSYLDGLQVPDNVILLGEIKDQQALAVYYSMADVTILASKRETFSMICAESLSCGTPVIGFEAGAPEMISLPEYSYFVKQGDIDAMLKSVQRILDQNLDHSLICEIARKQYSYKKMTEEYIAYYRLI